MKKTTIEERLVKKYGKEVLDHIEFKYNFVDVANDDVRIISHKWDDEEDKKGELIAVVSCKHCWLSDNEYSQQCIRNNILVSTQRMRRQF